MVVAFGEEIASECFLRYKEIYSPSSLNFTEEETEVHEGYVSFSKLYR